MSGKWTRGPWTVVRGAFPYHPGIDAGHVSVIVLDWKDDAGEGGIRGETPEEAEANACLIAAAPTLYKALQDMLAAQEGWSPAELFDPATFECVLAARAALAKARGETP